MYEFGNEEKNEKDIHLAVTWEIGEEWEKNYTVIPLLNTENIHQRDFHGLTHIFQSDTTKFYVIGLKEMLEFLNNPDEVQGYHKAKYESEL